MKNKNGVFLITSFIVLFVIALVGATYAFFSATITNGDQGSSVIVRTGTLNLVYSDNEYISNVGALPGSNYTKTITVTNEGDTSVNYDLVWIELFNNFVTKSDLVMSITCDSAVDYCDGLGETIIQDSGSNIPILYNISIGALETQTYTISITFKETGSNQNDNQGKEIAGKIGIIDIHDRNLEMYGYVYNQSGDPMSSVVVELHSDPISAITDSNGRYIIPKVSFGNHTLYVKTGDKTSTIMTSAISINLGTSTSSNNNNITVSQTRRKVEVNINKTATTPVVAVATKTPGTLKTANNEYYPDFYNYSIVSVNLEDHIDVPSDAISSWDVSEAQNNTVMAYILPSQYEGSYRLFIQSENKIIAPQDCGGLFSLNAGEINGLELLDTSNVTNMSGMFGDGYFSTLNLSNFNTSNVTDMSDMFGGYISSLDLSSFNTSNVTNMHGMFAGCENLQSLNISSFNTSNVTDMSEMFYHCSKLTSLDLSNFNTSNVTNMSEMFNCVALMPTYNSTNDIKMMNNSYITDNQISYGVNYSLMTSLNVSSFDTSKVANMAQMFSGQDSITNLNLSNFITTSVTDMSNMFGYMKSLTTLNIHNFTFGSVGYYSLMFYSAKNNMSITVKDATAQTFINSRLTDASLTGSVNIG